MAPIARIERDYLHEKDDPLSSNRVGQTFSMHLLESDTSTLVGAPKTRFRLLDDDRIPYYGGWLINDHACEVQTAILQWGAHDAGCTIIEVRKDGKWQQEIS